MKFVPTSATPPKICNATLVMRQIRRSAEYHDDAGTRLRILRQLALQRRVRQLALQKRVRSRSLFFLCDFFKKLTHAVSHDSVKFEILAPAHVHGIDEDSCQGLVHFVTGQTVSDPCVMPRTENAIDVCRPVLSYDHGELLEVR
jgi:hypothetical protein